MTDYPVYAKFSTQKLYQLGLDMPDTDTADLKTQPTLEQYFIRHQKVAIDYSLRVDFYEGKARFYIHPDGVNGETWNFDVEGNTLTCSAHTLS